MSIEAMKQMVEALQKAKRQCQYHNIAPHLCYDDAIEVGLKAITDAEKQEPKCVVIVEVFGKDWRLEYMSLPVGRHKLYTQQYLYTHPQPKREWVGLTDEERHEIREWQRIQEELGPVWSPMMMYLYLSIDAKLKEKNT